MNWIIKIILVSFIVFTSCAVNKKVVDQPRVAYARKYAAEMKEAAEFVIIFCRENKGSHYAVSDIKSRKKRNLLYNFGGSFSVIYRSSEILDSVVVFESMSIRYGQKKYYYDFAARERTFEDDTSGSRDYMFLKCADRIYYSRAPIPMM